MPATFDTPRPHQLSAIAQIEEGKRGIFHPYGLGKSWSSLIAAESIISSGAPFVIMCKKRPMTTWKKELAKRIPGPYRVYEIVGSSPWEVVYKEAVVDSIDEPHIQQIVLLSYSILASKLVYHIRYLKQLNIEAFIADESTKLKNPKAGITKAALKLSAAFPDSCKLILTGNPKPEGEYEVWSQFEFTGKNPFQRTYYHFLNSWFVMPEFGRPVLRLGKEEDFKRHLEQIGVWIHPTDLVKLRSELGLPLDQYINEEHTMLPAQLRLLDQLYETWALPDAQNMEFEMNYTMSLHQKAQQICSGFYLDDSKDIVNIFDTALEIPKIKTLRDVLTTLLTEEPERKIVIWRKFKAEDAIIYEGIADMFGIPPLIGPSEENLTAFLEDEYVKVIILPVDISESFNELVRADVDFFFSNDFSQEKRTQAEARINRMGQVKPIVMHIDLVSQDGRDLEIVTALQNKDLTPARLHTITNKYFKPLKDITENTNG